MGELMDRALVLEKLPRSGRSVPECGKATIRELIHGNYRIVYRIDKDALRILTVFEGHRLLRHGALGARREDDQRDGKDDE
jgi:toxin ParE1/3/4